MNQACQRLVNKVLLELQACPFIETIVYVAFMLQRQSWHLGQRLAIKPEIFTVWSLAEMLFYLLIRKHFS